MTGSARCDVETLEAALAASQVRVSAAEAQIASLKLMIENLRRALYGQRSERKERLLDQLELALDDLTADASADDLAAEKAAATTTEVKGFVRRKPAREKFTCRDCEKISQPPAPFHATPRGWAGPTCWRRSSSRSMGRISL